RGPGEGRHSPRPAPGGVADDPGGGRRARSRAGDRRSGRRESNQRRHRSTGAMMKRALVALAALAVLITTVEPASAQQRPSGEITVFAAASLTESFDAMAKQFQKKYPDVSVRFNYDASAHRA